MRMFVYYMCSLHYSSRYMTFLLGLVSLLLTKRAAVTVNEIRPPFAIVCYFSELNLVECIPYPLRSNRGRKKGGATVTREFYAR